MGKNLSNQYGQKLLDSAKKSRTDTIKTASKKQFKEQLKQLVKKYFEKVFSGALQRITKWWNTCTTRKIHISR